MKIAFSLYKYFPYGGLQRDFLRIARACLARGHEVHAFVLRWQGPMPDWLPVTVADCRALTNTGRYRRYTRWLQKRLAAEHFDLLVGFNKMPGLDVYYAADPCYAYKASHLRGRYYRFSPRYRHFSRYERAVFDARADTEILLISDRQKDLFRHYYHTPEHRLHLLPPGIDPGRRAPSNAASLRAGFRREFEIGEDEQLMLMVGSGFRTKGLDRALKAMAALPEDLGSRTRLFVVGQDNPAEFKILARSLGVANKVRFFAGRDDIPRFLIGADLLVHPAYAENTGTVLLEAVVAGLPVLVTDVCGYARYVREAGAGELVPTPFDPDDFRRRLDTMLRADKHAWRENGLRYAQTADIYSLPERAAELIERVGDRRL